MLRVNPLADLNSSNAQLTYSNFSVYLLSARLLKNELVIVLKKNSGITRQAKIKNNKENRLPTKMVIKIKEINRKCKINRLLVPNRDVMCIH